MEPQIFNDIWFRRIWSTWENLDKWRTDIRKNVLDNELLKTALFILEDITLIFISMDEMRSALGDATVRTNGSITFNVNANSKTVGNKKVKMEVHFPKDKKKALELEELLSEYK
jgi:hypothetical protein